MPSWANPIRLSRQRILVALGCGVVTIALFVGQAFWDSENQALPKQPPPAPAELPETTLPTYQPHGWPEPPAHASAIGPSVAEAAPEKPPAPGPRPDDLHQQILQETQQTNRHFKTLLDILSQQKTQPQPTPQHPTMTPQQAEAERKRLAEERKRERQEQERAREERETKLKAWKPQWVKPEQTRRENEKGRVHRLKTPWSLAPNTVVSFVTEAKVTNETTGAFRAFVSETVMDSATQTIPVLVQGTTLGMKPAGKNIFGDERIAIQLLKAAYKDKSIEFPETSVGDRMGTAGFKDLIDRHPWRFVMAGVLGILQGGTTVMAQASTGGMAGPVGAAVGNQVSQQGQQDVRQLLRTEPTITIRPQYQGTFMLMEALELNEPLL